MIRITRLIFVAVLCLFAAISSAFADAQATFAQLEFEKRCLNSIESGTAPDLSDLEPMSDPIPLGAEIGAVYPSGVQAVVLQHNAEGTLTICAVIDGQDGRASYVNAGNWLNEQQAKGNYSETPLAVRAMMSFLDGQVAYSTNRQGREHMILVKDLTDESIAEGTFIALLLIQFSENGS